MLGPGQVHSWSLSEDVEGDILFFSRDFFEGYFARKRLSDYPLFGPGHQLLNTLQNLEAVRPIRNIFSEIGKEYQSGHIRSQDLIRDYLDILINRISEYIQPSVGLAADTGSWQVRALQALIDVHYLQHYTPADYAAALNLSVKYLNELSQRYLGKTTTQLIHERIILEAKRLLAHGQVTVSAVALQLNFEDNSYFSRLFRKVTGMPPEQWRRRHIHA